MKSLSKIISESINSYLNEKFLYHVGKINNVDNPEPYYSEGRAQKFEGAGHETGSFGSGMYFTNAYSRDNMFNSNPSMKKNVMDSELGYYPSSKQFIQIGKGIYRVDSY